MKAALIVFVAAAAFFVAAQLGWLQLGSRPHAPPPLELKRIVAPQTDRPATTPSHSEIPQNVESGRVGDFRNADRSR